MRRVLEVSGRGIASAIGRSQVAPLETARSLGLKLEQRRAISLSLPQFGRRNSTSSSSGGFDNNNNNNKNSNQGTKKRNKKGLWEMASDKLSEVGAKTRSAAHKSKEALEHQVDRSMSAPGYSGRGEERAKNRGLDGQNKTTKSGYDYDARSGDKRSMPRKRSSDNHHLRNDGREHDGHDSADNYERKRRSLGASKDNKSFSDSGSNRSSKQRNPAADHRAAGSVRHDNNRMRFVLDLGDNQIARIDYKPAGKNCIELYHTEVPEELRGRGIGRSLAKGAFEAASRANLKLKVTCSYLEDYLKRHADDKHKNLFE